MSPDVRQRPAMPPRYRDLFVRFVESDDELEREQALLDASELGKEALADSPSVDQMIALHQETQVALAEDWQAQGADGERAHGRLARGDGISLMLALTLPHDLARLAHHERRWQREHDTLAAMFEQTDEMIVVLDAEGLIDDVNPAFVRATGWSPKDAATHTADAWPHGVPADGGPRHLEVRQRRRDGSVFAAEWSVSPVVGRDGRSVGHVCVGRDVGRRRQIEESLRENDKLRAVATLAGGIAHDFNNLLGSVLGLAELCALEAPEGSRLARNLDRIGQAGSRAALLVRQLLDFSRRTPAQLRTMQARPWLKQTQPLLRAALRGRAALSVRADDDGWVQMDTVQMEQVLLNLVRNAGDATDDVAREVRVELDRVASEAGEATAAGRLRLRVVDHGGGIDPELVDKIFEPFFTTKPVGAGTGLGLAAVHGIVSSHGGEVVVESRPGEGSTFSVFLPLVPPPAHPNDSQAPSASTDTPGDPPTGARPPAPATD